MIGMKVNIDSYTGFLVRIGCYYLVAVVSKKVMRWSTSPWDAYLIKDETAARDVAEVVSGHIVSFNPITGEVKEIEKAGSQPEDLRSLG